MLPERKDMDIERLLSWHQLLSEVIRDSTERQRMATEARVQEITLRRWASGISTPQPHNLRPGPIDWRSTTFLCLSSTMLLLLQQS